MSGQEGVVRWADLRPAAFMARLERTPVAYLPMGLCEPHGHIAAFGLDTHKADYICDEAARRFGGIVAPTQAYHVHETGPHAPWLVEVLGGVNPRMAGLPPDVILRTFLFQLRAFVNAGFRQVVAVSGHNGSQADLRLVAREFMAVAPVPVVVHTDPELVEGRFEGDHAGRYEVSQLMYCRPELVDLAMLDRVASDPLGRFAQNPDAGEATRERGREIIEACIERVGALVREGEPARPAESPPFIELADMEPVWDRVVARRSEWASMSSVV